jgi:hypothetical protein
MQEVRLPEVVLNTGNLPKHIQSSVNMARREFVIGCFDVGIAERSTYVVIPLWVLLVRRDIISKFILWIVAPKPDKSLEKM